MNTVYYPRRFGALGNQFWMCESIKILYEMRNQCIISLTNAVTNEKLVIDYASNAINLSHQYDDIVLKNIIGQLYQMRPTHNLAIELIDIFSTLRLQTIMPYLSYETKEKALPHGYHLFYVSHKNKEVAMVFGKELTEYECSFTIEEDQISQWRMNLTGDVCHKDPSIVWSAAHDMLLGMLTYNICYKYAPDKELFKSAPIDSLHHMYHNIGWVKNIYIDKMNMDHVVLSLKLQNINTVEDYLLSLAMMLNEKEEQEEIPLWI